MAQGDLNAAACLGILVFTLIMGSRIETLLKRDRAIEAIHIQVQIHNAVRAMPIIPHQQ